MKHSVYIAAPFFNEEQTQRVERVKKLLTNCNLQFFSPKDQSNLLFEENKENQTEVFNLNVKAIDIAKMLIVITNDKDTGTMFEAGLAFAKNKKIIYLFEGGKSFNLMLSNSGIATTSIDELEQMLNKLAKGSDYSALVAQQKTKYEVF